MYCNKFGSEEHIQAQYTLNEIGTGLTRLLAPILPHLSTEFMTHHPCWKDHVSNAMGHLLSKSSISRDLFTNENVDQLIEFTQKLRSLLAESSNGKIDFPKTVEFKGHFIKIIFRQS